MQRIRFALLIVVSLGAAAGAVPGAQDQKPPVTASTAPASPAAARPATPDPTGILPPEDYTLGPDDVLQVLFRYDKELTAEVTVRPDGMISLPMLDEIKAAGLTPDQLRKAITDTAKRFIQDPVVTVIVKEIKSRKVFITGEVVKPGSYPINQPMTVLQLIALAGGLTEYAKASDIVIMRTYLGGVTREAGYTAMFPFNYKQVVRRQNLRQNIELKPGDTVIVP